MSNEYGALCGRIVEKFGCRRDFAAAVGIKESTLYKKLSGKSQFKMSEVVQICRKLEIPLADAGAYFFTTRVKNSEFNGKKVKEVYRGVETNN